MHVCARTQISETAHTHKFAAHRHIVVIIKKTVIRETQNFSNAKTAPIQAEDPFSFFWSPSNFVHKNRSTFGWTFFAIFYLDFSYIRTLILGECPEKVRTHKNFCAQIPQKIRGNQGWKYQLVIDNRYYILCFSVIDYRRCFAFNCFYRLLPILCFLLTFYRLVESLTFTFVLVESP